MLKVFNIPNLLYLLINCGICYYISNIMLLFMTLDAVSLALDFVINNFNQNLTDSQIIQHNSKIYNIKSFERYVYYIIVSISYTIMQYLVFNENIYLIRQMVALTMLPIIFNDFICNDQI